MPNVKTEEAKLPLKHDGTLRLGVVADTHSRPDPAGMKQLATLAPDAILHAGDIGDLSVLEDLRKLAPVFAVRGNIDVRAADLPDRLTLDLVGPKGRPVSRILLMHIALAGPRLRAEARSAARTGHASLLVCGHSHVPFIGREAGITVFNPGSIGPRRFALPIVFGMIEVSRAGLDLRHVDAETGAPWLPRPAHSKEGSEG